MGEQPEKTIKRRRPKTQKDAPDGNREDFSIFLPPFNPAIQLTIVNWSEEVNEADCVFYGQEGSILKIHPPLVRNPQVGAMGNQREELQKWVIAGRGYR
jgi:hypothetical protein